MGSQAGSLARVASIHASQLVDPRRLSCDASSSSLTWGESNMLLVIAKPSFATWRVVRARSRSSKGGELGDPMDTGDPR
jgi:hypothetical protein